MIKFDGAAPLRFAFTEPERMFATREPERMRLAGLKLDSEATSEDETLKRGTADGAKTVSLEE